MQLANGVNVVQLSRVLGHHSAAFTLSVYTHLIPGEGAPALELADALSGSEPSRLGGSSETTRENRHGYSDSPTASRASLTFE
jgi:hypothetical protein